MESYNQNIISDEEYLDGHLKIFALPDDLLPSEEDTRVMWSLKPEVRPKCRVMGKILEMKLYSQTYLHDYPFSGLNHPCLPELHDVFQKYFDYTHILTDYLEKKRTNGILINWFSDGSEYIGKHADNVATGRGGNKRQLLDPGCPIVTISLGATRTFRIRDIKTHEKVLDVKVKHGDVCVMSYEMQSLYKHEITKQSSNVVPDGRISITLRNFC